MTSMRCSAPILEYFETANLQLNYVIVFILTVKEIYADMTPDRQKIYTDLTKTALGATEQTTNRLGK